MALELPTQDTSAELGHARLALTFTGAHGAGKRNRHILYIEKCVDIENEMLTVWLHSTHCSVRG